jgi:hypothetical protein
MNRKKPLKFEVAVYDGNEVEVKTMTREEAEAINPKDYDHYVAKPFGIFAFWTAAGKWIEQRDGKWAGIGKAGLDFIEAIQLNAGIFLRCLDLVELTGNKSYNDSNCVSACVLRLRRIHHESKAESHFFVTSESGEIGVCWPKNLTFVRIDAVRSKATDQDDAGSDDAASEEDKA